MQVNHLAPALLSVLLLPSLIRSSPSRIVNVNSIMHNLGFVEPEDMNMTSGKRKFTSMMGYANSKLARVHSLISGRNLGLQFVHVFIVHSVARSVNPTNC